MSSVIYVAMMIILIILYPQCCVLVPTEENITSIRVITIRVITFTLLRRYRKGSKTSDRVSK